MRHHMRTVLTLSALTALPFPALAATFDVGPSAPLTEVDQVPWESLAAGDLVQIHWRLTPYQSKWVIARRGTVEAPIVVRGIAGPDGALPVIEGRDATTRLALDYWNEERSVIKIGGSSVPPDTTPAHIVIEGLEIISGRMPHAFVNDQGASRSYIKNAASIHVEKGEHITIRGCTLRDSGNGLFISSGTSDVLIEACRIHGNGNVGSAFEHNCYTEALGITYQFNRFGSLRTGADGNNLKDRSADLVVRYNWIEGGNRQLDLVETDSAALRDDPAYRSTFVYGNVLIEPDDEGNSQIAHYGGDGGDAAWYRKGTLHFYNNTVVSTRLGNTTLLRLSTPDEHADVRNNIVLVTADGSKLAMLDETGSLALTNNWFKTGWQESHQGGAYSGTVTEQGTITGSTPRFVDISAQDYRLAVGSPCIDAAAGLHAAALPDDDVLLHYVRHQSSEPRPSFPPLDLGAFEHDPTAPVPAISPAGRVMLPCLLILCAAVASRRGRSQGMSRA